MNAPSIVGGGLDKAAALADRVQASLPQPAHRMRGLIAEDRKEYAAAERERLGGLSTQILNLVEERVDLAIHTGELDDSSLFARKLATTPVITVAAPAYLEAHGEPASPSELERHQCVIYAPLGAPKLWGFKGKFGNVVP